MYDVVIAGSGLGGLLCGYILSKEGYSVCIIEKNDQLGGCLQTFKRNNSVFDTGMHYIGSLDEGQILWRLFRYFDLNGKIKMKKLDEDVFDLFNFGGEEYKYAQGYNNFSDTLLQYFPTEKKAITDYMEKLKEIGGSISDLITKGTGLEDMLRMEYYSTNIHDYINSLTKNTKLQNVLAATNTFYAGSSETSSLYVHAIINNSFIESAWRFIDGGSQIADYLAASIITNGGVIKKNAEVEKFLMDRNDSFLESVLLSSGEKIFGKYFISNIHPVKTFEKLETKLIRKAYINRINSIENSMSVFSVYIVLKEDTFNYFNYNYYHYVKGSSIWGTSIYDKEKWPAGYMLYTPANSKSEIYADSITAITYMKYDELKKWENTNIEKRGDEYKEFKLKKAERLLDLIESKFPGIRSKIKAYYTSTPLTYRDYTGTVNGSIYGLMKDCNNPLKSFVIPRTRIPNLFLTGQNINIHGVLGVSIGALMTCSELVGFKYLLNKVNNA
jgi:all-trans-retinol 13,14-reductase